MLQKIFDLLLQRKSKSESKDDFQGVNRRKNTRVKYPEGIQINELPAISLGGNAFNVVDVSLGGARFEDPQSVFPEKYEGDVTIDLKIGDKVFQEKCFLVHAQNSQKHIRFAALDAQAYVRLSLQLKPGYLGTQFRRLDIDMNESEAVEVWVTSSSDKFELFDGIGDGRLIAEAHFQQKKIRIFLDRPPQILERENSYDIDNQLRGALIVCVANFSHRTASIALLYETLISTYQY